MDWSHYTILLGLKDYDEINYYITECNKYKLSKRQLQEKIKNKEYQKLSDSTKNKLKNGERLELPDLVKNPIVINSGKITERLSEKALKQKVLNDLDNFLMQIGEGTSYLGNEVKLEYKGNLYFVDILLFNHIYNTFIAVELKVGKLKKEDIIQTEIYTDVIDNTLRTNSQNKTIGVIVTSENNKYIVRFSTNNVVVREYELIKNI